MFPGADWVAMVFFMTSTILIGRRKAIGWLVGIVGGFLHGLIGYSTGNYGLILTELLFTAISINNYIKWRRSPEN